MNSSGIVTLYHTTSGDSAEKILAGKRMYRGSTGAFGGGIYFAETVADSKRKAHSQGVTLKASVLIGKSKVLPNLDNSITFTQISKEGYDSVTGTCLNGKEYIVYNCSQVRNIEVVENSVMAYYQKCTERKCARYGQGHYGSCGTLCSNHKCKMMGKLHHPKCKTKGNSIIF